MWPFNLKPETWPKTASHWRWWHHTTQTCCSIVSETHSVAVKLPFIWWLWRRFWVWASWLVMFLCKNVLCYKNTTLPVWAGLCNMIITPSETLTRPLMAEAPGPSLHSLSCSRKAPPPVEGYTDITRTRSFAVFVMFYLALFLSLNMSLDFNFSVSLSSLHLCLELLLKSESLLIGLWAICC